MTLGPTLIRAKALVSILIPGCVTLGKSHHSLSLFALLWNSTMPYGLRQLPQGQMDKGNEGGLASTAAVEVSGACRTRLYYLQGP